MPRFSAAYSSIHWTTWGGTFSGGGGGGRDPSAPPLCITPCTITHNLISSCHQQKETKLCACCWQHVPHTNLYKEECTALTTTKGPHCSSSSSSGSCIVALHATTKGKNHCFTRYWILPSNICTVKQVDELACMIRKQDHSDLKSLVRLKAGWPREGLVFTSTRQCA